MLGKVEEGRKNHNRGVQLKQRAITTVEWGDASYEWD